MATPLQQENFTFSHPSQNSKTLHFSELDLLSWSSKPDGSSKKKDIEGNKKETFKLSKEDPLELSLRDIVVEFPTISSYIKENYTQKTEKKESESFDGRIELRRNNKRSKWFLFRILFPLPSKKKTGRIGNNSLVSSQKPSIEKGEKNQNNNFDLWEENTFSDTSISSSSSSNSSSSNSSISSDSQNRRNSGKKNGCFPVFNNA